ncbi:MAG: hypothetical protein PHE89_04995 [Alphaproteobacteria bacterium]|nr:hypothetical protein [Alphaproteobacteria bacterium]
MEKEKQSISFNGKTYTFTLPKGKTLEEYVPDVIKAIERSEKNAQLVAAVASSLGGAPEDTNKEDKTTIKTDASNEDAAKLKENALLNIDRDFNDSAQKAVEESKKQDSVQKDGISLSPQSSNEEETNIGEETLNNEEKPVTREPSQLKEDHFQEQQKEEQENEKLKAKVSPDQTLDETLAQATTGKAKNPQKDTEKANIFEAMQTGKTDKKESEKESKAIKDKEEQEKPIKNNKVEKHSKSDIKRIKQIYRLRGLPSPSGKSGSKDKKQTKENPFQYSQIKGKNKGKGKEKNSSPSNSITQQNIKMFKEISRAVSH